jgi:hypothetical protein
MKLASLLERHRIDPIIKHHFREVIAVSNQSAISRYLDIILKSGSGPTVHEAIKNPTLFFMVIQLSLLAYVHEIESLANAIVLAIENMLRQFGAELDHASDYVSLLGIVRACQQQTAAFHWSFLYDAVDQKILAALRTSATPGSHKGAKRRKVADPEKVLPLCVCDRRLPFTVLQ